jgi:hypothetical protein
LEDEGDVGSKIRLFFRNLFGSRLADHMETEMMRLRADYETRLQERERTISDLREEVTQLKGKVDRYEMVLLPLASPMGGFFNPKPKEKVVFQEQTDKNVSSWAEYQAEYYNEQAKEQPDGANQGRQAQEQ